MATGEIFGPGGFTDDWIGGAGRQGILVIDRATGEDLYFHVQPADRGFGFSPERDMVVFYRSDSILILDVANFTDWEFSVDLGRIQALAIDIELRRIAVVDENGIHTFDLDTGDPLVSVLIVDVADVHWINADRLAVGTRTGAWASVSLLDEDLIASAAAGLTRGFTAEECAIYRIDPCATLEEIRSR